MAKKSVYYSLLCLNRGQLPSASVIASDGKTILPSLPRDARLSRYTSVEIWLWEHSVLLSGHETILDTFEAANKSLKGTKKELARQQKNAKQRIADDQSVANVPKSSRLNVRDDHLVLQLVCAAEDDGLETGFRDFQCVECGKRFDVTLAIDDPSRAEGMPEARIGFSETAQIIKDNTIECPLCHEWMFPECE